MKAVVIDEYGPPEVLRLADVEKPVPKRNEILVRVRAVAVTFGECKARNFKIPYSQFWLPGPLWLPARLMLGFSKPRHAIPGSEMSGDVEAVGEDVTSFKPGGQIFGFIEGFGADAEYVCFPEDAVVAAKPSNMTYEEAAPVTHGALTALCFIRKAGIKEGERVLVFGASGGIGRCAVQLAKNQGAHVTGVCSGPKMDVVKRLGADEAIDYTSEDFTRNQKTYDVIFDTVGKTSFAQVKGSLNENGRYLLSAFASWQLVQTLWTSMAGGKRVIAAFAPILKEDLMHIRDLMEEGKLKTIIDKSFPLERIAEAHSYVERRLNAGSVVVTV